MVIPHKPPLTSTHVTERLKLAANGLQAIALTVLGTAVISPMFLSLHVPWWERLVAGVVVGALERAAFECLRYIPDAPPPGDPAP